MSEHYIVIKDYKDENGEWQSEHFGPYKTEATAKRIRTMKTNKETVEGIIYTVATEPEFAEPAQLTETVSEIDGSQFRVMPREERPTCTGEYKDGTSCTNPATRTNTDGNDFRCPIHGAGYTVKLRTQAPRLVRSTRLVTSTEKPEPVFIEIPVVNGVESDPVSLPKGKDVPENIIYMIRHANSDKARAMWIRIANRSYGADAVAAALLTARKTS